MAEDAYKSLALSSLVRERMTELGLSLRKLEALCTPDSAVDHPAESLWKRGTLDNLLKGAPRITAPDVTRLQVLAAALQLPLRTVQEAAGRQFHGIDTIWTRDGKVRALIAGFDELDAEDQRRVLALMEARRRVKE